MRCTRCGCFTRVPAVTEAGAFQQIERHLVQGAIEETRQSLLDRPQNGPLHYRLSLCYYHLGLLDESADEMRRAVGLMPEKTECRYELALLEYRQKQNESALETVDKVLALDTENAEALTLRGVLRSHRGLWEQAVADWQRAYERGETTSRKHLESYIGENAKLIPEHLDDSSVPAGLAQYVRLLKEPKPIAPPEPPDVLLQVLDRVWPSESAAMRGRYHDRLAQFREALVEQAKQRKVMEDDIVGLSTLCVEAARRKGQHASEYDARSTQAARQARVLPASMESTGSELSLDERRTILEKTIARYSRRGFRIENRTDTTAQLVKRKEFSCLAASLWFLLFGIGILVYIVFYYMGKKDTVIFVEVDPRGRVRVG